MSKSAFPSVALATGIAGAVLLGWLWQRERQDAARFGDRPLPTPTAQRAGGIDIGSDVASPPAAAPLSAEARAMMAMLQRALALPERRPNEAVLAFKDDAALQRFVARAGKSGLTVLDRSDRLRAVRVRFGSPGALQDDLLANAADYDSVGANALIGIPQPPAKQDRAAQNEIPFGNETLGFLGASGDRTQWGRGTTIAILDTGVAPDATFGSGRLRAIDIGLGTAPGNGRDDGHGTSVAALAAGISPDAAGLAPAASLLSIRVTDANGLSDLFTVSQAILAAVDAGAKVINVSLGGYSTGAVLDAAINYAAQQGTVIVAAAGNDQAAQLAWPAADPRVVSVGAVDKAEQQVSFSNAGEQLQFTAPGYGVQSAWLDGARAYMNGTSASSPIVAGAIAAVMSQNPNLTAAQAVEILARTASDGGAPGADPAYGRGILNVGAAMNSSNPAYVDTAVSSHYYDAATGEMQFVVQNRSGRTVTGMSLAITAGTTTLTRAVPSLAPGETFVATAPVPELTLKASGGLSFTTQLTNPTGAVDQVPANNRRSSTLTAPGK